MQTTAHLLMIRPVRFGYNEQTAESNTFQKLLDVFHDQHPIQQQALEEFDNLVSLLRNEGVEVTVVEDTAEPHTPDAIFPNNWISFHQDGTVMLYPMQAENRRKERRTDILPLLEAQGYKPQQTLDLTHYEEKGKFLEGTGSLVLDRENKLAYACISPRTDPDVLHDYAEMTGFQIVRFRAQSNGKDIYHTNVVMSLGEAYCTICLDTIDDLDERLNVVNYLTKTNKEIIEITQEQMNRFAGNMLQVKSKDGRLILVMSEQAYQSLDETQVSTLEKHGKLLHSRLNTIETNGGGSARCMIAEVFLPR